MKNGYKVARLNGKRMKMATENKVGILSEVVSPHCQNHEPLLSTPSPIYIYLGKKILVASKLMENKMNI